MTKDRVIKQVTDKAKNRCIGWLNAQYTDGFIVGAPWGASAAYDLLMDHEGGSMRYNGRNGSQDGVNASGELPWNMRQARRWIMQLRVRCRNHEDHLDLMVDEFKRIKALRPGPEIEELCDRGIATTLQHVPVIEQRDNAEEQVEVALRELAIFRKRTEEAEAELATLRAKNEALSATCCDHAILDERGNRVCRATGKLISELVHPEGTIIELALTEELANVREYLESVCDENKALRNRPILRELPNETAPTSEKEMLTEDILRNLIYDVEDKPISWDNSCLLGRKLLPKLQPYLASSQASTEPANYPWQSENLGYWDIVGMNHYRQGGNKRIFVAMTKNGRAIKAEGTDGIEIWKSLEKQAYSQSHAEPAEPDTREEWKPCPDHPELTGYRFCQVCGKSLIKRFRRVTLECVVGIYKEDDGIYVPQLFNTGETAEDYKGFVAAVPVAIPFWEEVLSET